MFSRFYETNQLENFSNGIKNLSKQGASLKLTRKPQPHHPPEVGSDPSPSHFSLPSTQTRQTYPENGKSANNVIT